MGEIHRSFYKFRVDADRSKANAPTGGKSRHRFLIMIVGLLLCILSSLLFAPSICGQLWNYLIQPDYIELDVPFPRRCGWSYTEKGIQDWYGSKYAIWKREGLFCSLSEMNQTQVGDYFDDWLGRHGWTRSADSLSCSRLPEANFLPQISEGYPSDTGGYISYLPPDAGTFEKRAACLFIWPDSDDGDTLKIVLATLSPDFMTAMQD